MQKNKKIEKELKEIFELTQDGRLDEALRLNLNCIKLSPTNYTLLTKYAYLNELYGDFKIAEFCYEKNLQHFHRRFEAKVNLLNFYLRTGKLKEVQRKLKQWFSQFGQHQNYMECKIRLLILLWKFADAKLLVERYIEKFPDSVFGHLRMMNIIGQERLGNFRTALGDVYKNTEGKKFSQEANRIYQNIRSTYIDAFQKDAKITFGYYENSKILLKSFLMSNPPEKDFELNYIFKNLTSLKAMRCVIEASLFSKTIQQQLLNYLDENPHWKNYHFVQKHLEICTQNIGLAVQDIPTKPIIDKKIDIVYAWCDFDDPVFQNKLNKIKPNNGQDSTFSNGAFRYQHIGEIKLSLLSVQKHFAQVNQIYIVINEQQFDINFLNPDFQNKIKFIDHTEILPESLTKDGVFNSNLIETFIWRIKGLSDCFLYFNDDVMLGDYLDEKHIFNGNNVPFVTLIPHHFKTYKKVNDLIEINPTMSYYIACLHNAHQQFIHQFNIEPHLGPLHQVMIMTKSSCKHLFEIMKPSWQKSFYKDRTRGNKSVYALMMYNWFALLKGHQILGPYFLYKRRSIYFSNEINQHNIEAIQNIKPLFYCFNYISDETSRKLLNDLIDSLST